MATLASATLDLARLIGEVVDSTATATGSTTTLIDAGFPKRDSAGDVPADDYYNYGTIWFLDCTSTGIEGKSAIVSDFESSTATFTYAGQLAATASGDTYAVMESIWPRYKLQQAVNLALQGIMAMPALDTSLTTESNTETLTLPAGVYNVRHIQIAKSTVDPYYFSDISQGYWEEKNGYIYFKPGHWPDSTDYTVRLWYEAVHTNLSSDTSSISAYIHPLWLAWESAVHAYRWRKPLDESGKVDGDRIKEAIAMAAMYRNKFRDMIPKLPWKVKLANWQGDDTGSQEFTGTVRV